MLNFYNARRAQLKEVEPNAAHIAIQQLEKKFDVHVITQNVDDLHERAGSSQVLHLHGQLTKVRSVGDESLVYDWHDDVKLGDLCESGFQLRPHIVWFGEAVPAMEEAVAITSTADVVMIVGTSLQVYPAASLFSFAPPHARIFYIDPHPAANQESRSATNFEVIAETATAGVPPLVTKLMNE